MNISIDIGTSHSSVFYLDASGAPQPVKTSTGMSMYGSEYSLPSAIYVDKNGQVLVGQAAMNSRKQDPTRFRSEFKRNLGQDVPIVLGDRSMLPEEMYTEIFRHLKACAEKASGEITARAFVTHPAAFSESKKQKVLEAANAAGLFDVTLIDEPTAAAMCYCSEGKVKNGQTLLVYDFGGGTFDSALIRYENGQFLPLTEAIGLERCGGIDIDRLIYADMLKTASDTLEASGIKQNRNAMIRFQAMLSELAMKAKCHLTSAASFDEGISLGFDYIDYSLTAEQLGGMISGLIQQTIECCHMLLANAGLTVNDLDCILLVGGTSRVPLVEQMVRKFAGNVPVLANADPELVVAQGALMMKQMDENEQKERKQAYQNLASVIHAYALKKAREQAAAMRKEAEARNAAAGRASLQTEADTIREAQQRAKAEALRRLQEKAKQEVPPSPSKVDMHNLLLEQRDVSKIAELSAQAMKSPLVGMLSLYTDELHFSTTGSALSELLKKRVKPGRTIGKLFDGSLKADPSAFALDELLEVSEVENTVISMPLWDIRSYGVHEFKVVFVPAYALCIQMHDDSLYRFVMPRERANEFCRLIQMQLGR